MAPRVIEIRPSHKG